MERDAGFCSGGSEIGDEYQSDRIQSSPSSTDASDDSVDIKLARIVIPPKRKAYDAIKCENDIPLKKRFKYETVFDTSANQIESINADKMEGKLCPWIPEQLQKQQHQPNEADILARHPGVTTLHRVPSDINSNVCQNDQDDQPLALVIRKTNAEDNNDDNNNDVDDDEDDDGDDDDDNDDDDEDGDDNESRDFICKKKTSQKIIKTNTKPKSLFNEPKTSSRSAPQRNYKNMTRERRIEANARERTRVHTISAAFDTLRQAIPSYSNTQKLSKLSVLRVACTYILTLSRMNGLDYSEDQSAPSVQSCLEEITKTIQTEGKARKRKDE